MVTQLPASTKSGLSYPSSDGQPMADNTKQFRWIVVIQQNLEWLFADQETVFVAGDLLWYPVEGDPKSRMAPDIMVAFGRPKGDRGSYQQWLEDHIPPQVVFEILSPGNRVKKMVEKLRFYERYGVEEYYIYDPDGIELTGLTRSGEELVVISQMSGWVSPRLGIRFNLSDDELQLYRPDGQPFLSYVEIARRAEQERDRADQAEQEVAQERDRADQAEQEATQERDRADQAEQRAAQLENRLRAMGINPDA
jgi:Uma2 family endonuclease